MCFSLTKGRPHTLFPLNGYRVFHVSKETNILAGNIPSFEKKKSKEDLNWWSHFLIYLIENIVLLKRTLSCASLFTFSLPLIVLIPRHPWLIGLIRLIGLIVNAMCCCHPAGNHVIKILIPFHKYYVAVWLSTTLKSNIVFGANRSSHFLRIWVFSSSNKSKQKYVYGFTDTSGGLMGRGKKIK